MSFRACITTLFAVALLAVAAAPAGAGVKRLLAPKSACGGQLNVQRTASKQVQTARCMINYARARKGIGPVGRARPLQRSTRRKARDVVRCGQFSHYACGRDPFHWLAATGFARGCWGGGENLAWGSGRAATPRDTVRRWLLSPPHRRVLFTRSYRRIGLAVRKGRLFGSGGAQLWVAHLGYRC